MPKKTVKPAARKPASKSSGAKSSSGHTYNIDKIHAGRDVIMGDQENTFYQTAQTLNVTSPNEFIEELQKLKAEIERLKSLPGVEPAAARRLVAVEGDIEEAIVEAEKDKPVAERINSTLDGAKETMDKLRGSIVSAVNLGTTLGGLALLAWKVFGGG
jgi:hypothetical protein